jgi:serine palmitoyltransferase
MARSPPASPHGGVSESYHTMPVITLWTACSVYFGWGVIIFFGHIRDFFRHLSGRVTRARDGYAPIVSDFEDFYARRAYGRLNDCFHRSIVTAPKSQIKIIERERIRGPLGGYTPEMRATDRVFSAMNLGSYDYLGFGDDNSTATPAVLAALEQYSVSTCSPRAAAGTTPLIGELESTVARFVGKDAAIVFAMGFGTNATGVPALMGPGTLIISDELNHASFITGARTSGAKIAVFKHSDLADLERVIRAAIVQGQPRSRRPWRRIMIAIEGIYSMEGEFCPLAEIIALKKKYRCLLYVDEAHSIGAVGPTGRGVCEHMNVNPADVDILMGTFSKSFGGVGGYLAADKRLIAYLRTAGMGSVHSPTVSPPTCKQITTALQIIMGEDGTDDGARRVRRLYEHSNYFRNELRAYGFHVLGQTGSPVVPVMFYRPSLIKQFSQECLKHGLAIVVVGFPATPLLLSRARFCISASHSREDVVAAVEKIKYIGDMLGMRYGKSTC